MTFRFERIHHAPGQYRYYLTGNDVNCVIENGTVESCYRQLKSRSFEKDFVLTIVTGLGILKGDTVEMKLHNNNIRTCVVASYDIDGDSIPIYSCAQKGSHFFDGFSFYSFAFEEKVIEVYEVGFGRKGIYWCVYADDMPIIVFSMDMVEKGNGSGYTVYCDEGIDSALLAIIGVLMDITHNPPGDGYNRHRTLNTWQKKLKDKYPRDFMLRHQK